MQVFIPDEVKIVELESAPYKTCIEAKAWVREHGVVGLMSNVDSGGKGEISISIASIVKMISGSAMRKSVTPVIHLAALARIRDIIRESIVCEIHPDYAKIDGRRDVRNPVNPNIRIAVLFGAVMFGGFVYRAKTTLKLHKQLNQPTKAYAYEITRIEILKGNVEDEFSLILQPSDRISISRSILLNGVTDVNGEQYIRRNVEGIDEKYGEIR